MAFYWTSWTCASADQVPVARGRSPRNGRRPGPPGRLCRFQPGAVDLSDGRLVALTESPGHELSPQFSPDGNWIAFVRIEGRRQAVYVMEVEGGEAVELTRSLSFASSPVWAPASVESLHGSE